MLRVTRPRSHSCCRCAFFVIQLPLTGPLCAVSTDAVGPMEPTRWEKKKKKNFFVRSRKSAQQCNPTR